MNKSKFWYIIPSAILPYLVLCIFAVILTSTENPVSEFVMGMFGDNIFILSAVVLIYCIAATVLSVIHLILSIVKNYDALSLAKIAMIMKLVQVPGYILIFILGALFFVSIFTFAFTAVMYFLDCWFLILSGLVALAAVINALRQGVLKRKDAVWIIILQFIFCADVVAAVILYAKLKKSRGNTDAINETSYNIN